MSRRALAIAAAATLATTMWVAGPSGAGQVVDPVMTIAPEEGPPGTVITVNGDGCITKGSTSVDVSLFDDIASSRPDEAPAPPDENGEWTATLTVPADTTDYGEWRVSAVCTVGQE